MKNVFTIIIFLVIPLSIYCQSTDAVFVDDSGLMRWQKSNEIVSLFGVNYTTPFAHSYRALDELGYSHKEAIDMDVAQMVRLGFNAYRIHMWDREISDSTGNLIENVHLELFDYLIMKLKERNISIILTPIAWWGPGWPEPDPESPGFSNNYSKVELTVNDTARAAQRKYLKQVINHKNIYTGLTYKDDPSVIAFEIINEPGHPGNPEVVTNYINEMVKVLRDEKITKPIFYNISQNWSDEQAAAVYNADIDGISFQWYPTGLVKNSELKGNYLPHVDKYPIPNSGDKNYLNKAKMVYEFDAADVSSPIMYPAMARSFREAGMQWVTMFSYDPTAIAKNNTEYNTHFLNLNFTPEKAISIMIAAEVIKQVKPYQKFGNYPQTLKFGDFKISYEDQLSELNSKEKFYYSNSTESKPKDIVKLKHIAGIGNSSVVSYNGKGSYFLDKLTDGIWRLELYPDAVWIDNPYGKNSLSKTVAQLYSTPSNMKFYLPDLNGSIYLKNLKTNTLISVKENEDLIIEPGVYILSKSEVKDYKELNFSSNNLKLEEFPSSNEFSNEIFVKHSPTEPLFENSRKKIRFEIYTSKKVEQVSIYYRKPGWRNFAVINSSKINKYEYESILNFNEIGKGKIEYCVNFKIDGIDYSYPSGINKNPNAWDFYADKFYEVNVLDSESDLVLFDPDKNMVNLNYPNVWSSVRFRVETIYSKTLEPFLSLNFSEIRNPINEFTFQIELDEDYREIPISEYKNLKIELGEYVNKIDSININLIDNNMNGNIIKIGLTKGTNSYIIPLSKLQDSKIVLLPRPYPHFLPYYFEPVEDKNMASNVKQINLNSMQVGIPLRHLKVGEKNAQIEIKRISLTK